jgi:hypothetical protein
MPVGTGFWVGDENKTRGFRRFLVTAKHIASGYGPTWVRIRLESGGVCDLPVSGWTHHPESDVSVAPFNDDLTGYIATYTDVSAFIDRFTASPNVIAGVSDPVHYVGLLAAVPTMQEDAIPMVRSGSIGALYQLDIPSKDRMGTVHIEPLAHLIDARARLGFSGAPCLVEKPTIKRNESGDLVMGSWIGLLGVITGVFSAPSSVFQIDDPTVETALAVAENTGVTVVVPVEKIREVMHVIETSDRR